MPVQLPPQPAVRWVAIAAFVLQAIVLTATGVYWVTGIERDIDTRLVVQDAQILALETLIRERTADRYRGDQARADQELTKHRIGQLEIEVRQKPPKWLLDRIEALERRLNMKASAKPGV